MYRYRNIFWVVSGKKSVDPRPNRCTQIRITMRNFIKIFPHVLIWTIVLIVPTYLMSREGVFDSKPFYNYCIRISLLAILFYFNYLYLIEKFLFNRKIITYISINIVLVIIIVALQTTISDLLAFSIPVNMQEHSKDFPRMEDHRRGGP